VTELARARRNRKVLDAVTLEDGETIEVVSVAEIGTLRPSPATVGTTAAIGIAAMAMGEGLVVVAVRTRCGLVLTNRRLILVEASKASGKMLGVVADMPRERLCRGEVSTRAYLWFDVADTGSDSAIRLSFPLPNRAEGRQVAAAIPAPQMTGG
jgi:hypothetical protein